MLSALRGFFVGDGGLLLIENVAVVLGVDAAVGVPMLDAATLGGDNLCTGVIGLPFGNQLVFVVADGAKQTELVSKGEGVLVGNGLIGHGEGEHCLLNKELVLHEGTEQGLMGVQTQLAVVDVGVLSQPLIELGFEFLCSSLAVDGEYEGILHKLGDAAFRAEIGFPEGSAALGANLPGRCGGNNRIGGSAPHGQDPHTHTGTGQVEGGNPDENDKNQNKEEEGPENVMKDAVGAFDACSILFKIVIKIVEGIKIKVVEIIEIAIAASPMVVSGRCGRLGGLGGLGCGGGFGGLLGFKGFLFGGGAAGGQAQVQDHGYQNCKQFFHFSFLLKIGCSYWGDAPSVNKGEWGIG